NRGALPVASGEPDLEEMARAVELAETGNFDPLRQGEAADWKAMLFACLEQLAQGDAAIVLVNLEDLWGETRPQNTPGTFLERPNWRLRAVRRFEEFSADPEILELLRRIDALRRAGP